jgi:hypothetical protein
VPDTPSITIIKEFSYRGDPEEYSNTYHFEGTTPTDTAAWKALADAIIAAERSCYDSTVTWVRAYGYVAGNENSVAQIDYEVAPNVVLAGTGTGWGGNKLPGDAAATTRWYTGQNSSRGKKVYCRKYWHPVHAHGTDPDQIIAGQRTALQTFAAKLIDGSLPGSFKYCGPQGADLQAPETSQWVTTRTLKRRGKRPPTSP